MKQRRRVFRLRRPLGPLLSEVARLIGSDDTSALRVHSLIRDGLVPDLVDAFASLRHWLEANASASAQKLSLVLGIVTSIARRVSPVLFLGEGFDVWVGLHTAHWELLQFFGWVTARVLRLRGWCGRS